MKKLDKVLIANRGEIAVRIIRACRECNIRTVAVYSEPDRNSLHVRLADEAVALGGKLASESYLLGEKLIEVAKEVSADAIHPGYGFLSENAGFSRLCRESGVKFIGPPPEAIEPMGDKIEARRLMKEAGVPVVPGSDGPIDNVGELKKLADEVGYPVMIKAAAGGGGKGIRKVQDEGELESAFRQASSEAEQSFGSGAVYLEKLIAPARHIEIQVLTDSHGNGLHLGERECSLQRRSQKLVEETPSLFVTEELRKKMTEVSVKGALAIGYEGAGTMEFLVDEKGGFYFIEMNTRLQVEHAITEMVTGVDLVKEQLHVAAGNPLTLKQDEISFRGHSIELRVCSEDPFNNFVPSVGTIDFLQLPSGPHVRLDSSLYEGLEVTLFYDPMIAKLVVWAPSRLEAIKRMEQAVREFVIDGVQTSLPLLLLLAQDKDFLSGNFHTNWLEGFVEEVKKTSFERETEAALAAALLSYLKRSCPNVISLSENKSEGSSWKKLARLESVGRVKS